MNQDGSNQIRLTGSTDMYSYNPSISPDGKKIMYVEESYSTGNEDIYLFNVDTGTVQLNISPNDDDYAPVFS